MKKKMLPLALLLLLLAACGVEDGGTTAAPAPAPPWMSTHTEAPSAAPGAPEASAPTEAPPEATAAPSTEPPAPTPERASPTPERLPPSASPPPSTAPAEPPAAPSAQESPPPAGPTVTIAIDGVDGAILGATTVGFEAGDSVFDALRRACEAHGLAFDWSGSGKSVYVRGIGGLYEQDHGPLSGWTYAVNGETPGKSCGAYVLEEGDEIRWVYQLEPA